MAGDKAGGGNGGGVAAARGGGGEEGSLVIRGGVIAGEIVGPSEEEDINGDDEDINVWNLEVTDLTV